VQELAINVKQLTKSFYSSGVVTPALRGVDLQVHTSELMMLVGPSGCGKTTLISCIAGILSPDSGTCSVLGYNLNSLSDRQKTRFRCKEIGFIFQSFNLIPTITVLENVIVPLLLNNIKQKLAKDIGLAVLNQVGLADRAYSLPHELSGGQQQRVAIARALVHNPRLIVADEPTSALDYANGQKIMEMFREVALSSGRSLLIVSHDSRIYRFADRIAEMSDGVIVKMSVPDNVQKNFEI